MAFPLDLKAIGLGVATFVLGYLLMSILATGAVNAGLPPSGKSGWALVQIAGYVVPIIAGCVSAYRAPDKRILHGIVGGALGVVLLLVPALFTPQYPFWGLPIVIGSYAMLAALGGIIGNHLRNRVGP